MASRQRGAALLTVLLLVAVISENWQRVCPGLALTRQRWQRMDTPFTAQCHHDQADRKHTETHTIRLFWTILDTFRPLLYQFTSMFRHRII